MNFKKIINKKWYVQGFNSSMNFIAHGPWSSLLDMHKVMGYGYTETLFVFDKDYLEYHYLEKDFEDVGNEFVKRFKQDKNYFSNILMKDKELVKSTAMIMKEVDETNLSSLSNEELISLYKKMWEGYHSQIGVSHVIEGISYIVEPLLKKKIENVTGLDSHDVKFRKMFNKLMQSKRPSFINEEQMDLLLLLKQFQNIDLSGTPKDVWERLDENYKNLITIHKKRFYFNQLNYYHGDSLNELDYISEIQKLKGVDPIAQIKEEEKRYDNNEKYRKAEIQKLNLDDETINYIYLLVDVLHWQDDRKKVILMGVYHMNLLLTEISNRYNIPLEMLKMYFPVEINKEFLENFDFDDGKFRLKHLVVYMWYHDKKLNFEVYTKEKYEEFMKIYFKDYAEKSDIHGNCASSGTVSGIVRVCKTKEDIAKVEKGDIIVSPMTRPEYVPAMRIAGGIITDEGGVTCHAAIVSREIGIPCIIGTKNSTKVLKDGMLVEIRANHGIVKVLK